MSNGEMQISEAELNAMTATMVDMHEETFPALKASLAEMTEKIRAVGGAAASRRGFMAGGAAVAGGVLLSACGGKSSSSSSSSSTSAPTGSSSAKGDVQALMLNASIENLAVFAYGAALTGAGKGMFGKSVPPAIATFATTAKQQHTDHAQAFNAALTNAGGTAYTKPDPALAATVTSDFGKLTDVVGLAKLALTLENTAAATYIAQMSTLTSTAALNAVATIAPVEAQHAAILYFVLGEYPVPASFFPTAAGSASLGARPVSDVA